LPPSDWAAAMAPKKKGGKGKGKKDGVGKPAGPTPAELQAKITELQGLKEKEEQGRNTMQIERV